MAIYKSQLDFGDRGSARVTAYASGIILSNSWGEGRDGLTAGDAVSLARSLLNAAAELGQNREVVE